MWRVTYSNPPSHTLPYQQVHRLQDAIHCERDPHDEQVARQEMGEQEVVKGWAAAAVVAEGLEEEVLAEADSPPARPTAPCSPPPHPSALPVRRRLPAACSTRPARLPSDQTAMRAHPADWAAPAVLGLETVGWATAALVQAASAKAELAAAADWAAVWAEAETAWAEAVTLAVAGSASAAVTPSVPPHQHRPAAAARTRAR